MPPAARQLGREDASPLKKRVTGLLNKLSDANLPQISGEVIALMRSESRRDVIDIVSNGLLEVSASISMPYPSSQGCR